MMIRAQWVVERRDLHRLVEEIEVAGGHLLARSQFEPGPEDLDAFAIEG